MSRTQPCRMLFLIRTLKLNSPTNTKRNTKFAQRMSRSLPRYLPNQEVASGRISPPELARHEGSVFLCKNPPNYRETSAGNRNNRGRRGCGNWDGRQSSYNHNRDQTDSMDTKYHGRERERERAGDNLCQKPRRDFAPCPNSIRPLRLARGRIEVLPDLDAAPLRALGAARGDVVLLLGR
jgi:hypothetical protein